jgi:hypothetical protein
MGKVLTGARSLQDNLYKTVDLDKHEQNFAVRNSIAVEGITIVAEASVTEEPDAGKPHVRICAGDAG